MSTLKVTIEPLEIFPHPNADKLELAQVGLYRAVVPKGVYKTGDYAIYIPEQAIVPQELLVEMDLVGKLAGKEKNRVKAIRLRGELSQGIVCRPQAIDEMLGGNWADAGVATRADVDFAEVLGITKWQPPIPTQMAGKVAPAERLLRWVDIENIKRYPDLFEEGEPVVATEKIHGTCFLLTWMDKAVVDGGNGQDYVAVTSKGYGSKGLAIERDPANLYWRAVNAYSLEAFADRVSLVAGAPTVGLFGEVYGSGVQDLAYGADANRGAPGFALFDIAVDYGDGVQVFLRPAEFAAVVEKVNADLLTEQVIDEPIATAPVLYEGPYSQDLLIDLAEGNTEMGDPPVKQIREGLVVRPAKESYSPVTGGRKIGKLVAESYLTRGGNATEFE